MLKSLFPDTALRRAWVLAAIILVQGLCAMFFVSDAAFDLAGDGRAQGVHMFVEGLASAALLGGVIYLMVELRQLVRRMREMDRGIRAARGEMAELMEGFFDDWDLTPSERDVALMILKGIDNEGIARLRGTAAGTVRAQSARVYAKAGVEGRAQLVSLFVEELFRDGP